ncbi:hypothetical protein LCGC14_2307260 [marine sediment metagenome]|uniref:Uncharacterized protein n=1 Tax=marine sediment metagenome TaxID=412755 RepID=A0A0F9FGN5_9ZZZZ
MYNVIGLREDGRMVLFDSYNDLPDDGVLTRAAEGFHYTQLLIISSNGIQVGRYEYENAPKLKKVTLA